MLMQPTTGRHRRDAGDKRACKLKHTRIRSTNVKWSEASLADRKQRVTSTVNHLPKIR